MTFNYELKEELSKLNLNVIERNILTLAYLIHSYEEKNNKLMVRSSNPSVTRILYINLKELFSTNTKIAYKKETKQVYYLVINDYKSLLNNMKSVKNQIESLEEKTSFLMGTFLAVGNITDPKTSRYHLEFVFKNEKDLLYISNLLNDLNMNSNTIKRQNNYVLYIKSSENISDLLKLFKVYNTVFELENVLIKREHKNLVNRLNNCELANQEKITKTGLRQVSYINLLKERNYFKLLDTNTQLIANYRLKFPEYSYNELSEIIYKDIKYKISKSGISHHFIKIKKLHDKINIKEN